MLEGQGCVTQLDDHVFPIERLGVRGPGWGCIKSDELSCVED